MSAPAPAAAAALAALADAYWARHLEWDPLHATLVGERAHDHRLPDLSPAGQQRQEAWLAGFVAQVEAVDPAALAPDGRLTRLELASAARADQARLAADLGTWTLDPLDGPQVSLPSLPTWNAIADATQADAYLERVRAMGPYLEQHVANLERGLASGRVAAADPARKVAAQLAALLAQPAAHWSLVRGAVDALPPAFDPAARRGLAGALERAVEESARPGFAALARLVDERVLPVARPGERAGLSALEGGAEAYRALVRAHTSLALDPEAVHATGLAEVARINDETRALGARVLGEGELGRVQERLRGDPALFFETREQVEATALAALRRAEAAVPGWFGRLPATPCVVRRIEPNEEEFTTIAYYRQPAVDGSRPGTYHVNTFAPTTRPRYEAECLAFHEAVPGHHTQIAIAQELAGLPAFRRHLGPTAFVEGWALYTERLCDEMGIYGGDLDRFGMLSFDSWRACRLVVDTGMHALGWSRQRAVDFMHANSVLAPNNIANEVDRYITWPGQAVSYKTGQLEILRLRDAARARLGGRFDIRAFHDAVLGSGAVGLGTLREIVDAL